MKGDTRKLLQECSSGCKMALNSMEQVEEYLQDGKLRNVIEKYREIHGEIEKDCAELLMQEDAEEKEPGIMASAFSWITTETKLMLKDSHHQIAKIMMDGCNMGIQSVCEYENKYTEASNEAKSLAKKLVVAEEDFVKELKEFL